MGSNFNFSIKDLASNDVSSDTSQNPYMREFLKGSPTNKALQTSSAYLATQGQNPDTYVSNSMLSMSDVMMGVPLQNRASGVANVQQVLTSSVLQYGHTETINKLGIFKALLPTDLSQMIQSSANSASTTGSTDPTSSSGAPGANITPSQGVPTSTAAPGGLPSGTGPTGLPPGFVAYPTTGVPVLNFLNLALSKVGDAYVWGAEGPSSFDCSGLVMWCLQQLGSQFKSWPHFSGTQYQKCVEAGLNCALEQAYNTAGALLFVAAGNDPAGEHVAISLGNNNGIVEAYSTGIGVVKGTIKGQYSAKWDVAGLIPGLNYGMVVYGQGISTMPTTSGGNPLPSTRVSG